MKMIFMNGGLGNQLFQYIFYRFLEENSGDDCYIDDRYFFHTKKHFGYEINKIFGLSPKLLSEHFDNEVWEAILNTTKNEINIIDYFKEAGLSMEVVSEGGFLAGFYKNYKIPYTGKFHTFDANTYAPEIAKLNGNVYYHGYWINMNWLKNVKNQIIQELKFPEIDDDYNKKIAEKICACPSVGVHVRRGDFLTLGWGLDPRWYREKVIHMKQVRSKPVFFIFSDDTDWCRSNTAALGFDKSDNVVFVEGNTGGKNFRDMQLMTFCRNLIIANSSFSYLAALLNQNPDKYVINPVSFRQVV